MTAIAKSFKDNLNQLLMRLSLRRLELHGTRHGNTCMCSYFHFHFIAGPPPHPLATKGSGLMPKDGKMSRHMYVLTLRQKKTHSNPP